jgi:hypothetical protein
MALPEIKHPVHKLKVPSSNKEIRYRPYTVKEEKLLLTVRLSDDIEEIIETIKQIIQNCVYDEIDPEKLAMFDVEYIFVNLRKVSVSNEVEMYLDHEGKKIPFKVDLNNVKIRFDEKHTNIIQINDDVSIKLRYPNIKQILRLESLTVTEGVTPTQVNDYIFDMFIDCIESIMDSEKVYSDFTREELSTFVLSLPSENNDKILQFFNTMPTLEHTVNVKLPNGETKEATLRGLKDFFTS